MTEVTTVKMLMRVIAVTPFGMFSELTVGDRTFYTVEPLYKNNEVDVSAIPAGIYDVARIADGEGQRKLQVLNVDGRTEIMIHAGNRANESHGCILPGFELGCIDYEWGVVGSRSALAELNNILDGVDQFTLYIDRSVINQDMNFNDRRV